MLVEPLPGMRSMKMKMGFRACATGGPAARERAKKVTMTRDGRWPWDSEHCAMVQTGVIMV